jgi:SAM-dependent methyltransferase
VYQNPQVVERDRHKLYPLNEYEPFQAPKRAGRGGVALDRMPAVAQFARETLGIENVGDRIAKRLPRGARWLDVGCGSGTYMHRLRERFGIETFGVDISEAAVAAARSAGLEVFHGEVHNAPYAERSFDTVSGWWYLEHVSDPRAVVARMAAFLKPGGTLLIGVPNYASLNARLFRSRWYHLDCPRHLTIWTPGTIRRLLTQEAGLSLERIAYDRATWGLLGSLQYATFGDNLASAHKDRLRGSRVLAKALMPLTLMVGFARVSDTMATVARTAQ